MATVIHNTPSPILSNVANEVTYGFHSNSYNNNNYYNINNVTIHENLSTGAKSPGPTILSSIEVDRLLWIYWSPFTFFLGLIGNILVIRIFGFAKSTTTITTTSTTSIYFTVMAVADVSFLIFGIVPEWLEHCRFIKIKETHYTMCKLEKFLFYTSGDVAIWIICVNTFDRFVAVCFPFTQQIFRKALYAKVSSVVTLVLAVGKNFHVFWTRGMEYHPDTGVLLKLCGRPAQYRHFEYFIRPWIAFALIAVLPFTLLAFFNIFIIRFLIREMRRVRLSGKKNQPDFTQTICMCVAVALAFLIFVTPSLILYIGKPYWTSWENPNYAYNVSKAITNQLSYVNHSINFLLYCITAKKFRDEAVKILVPKRFRQYFLTHIQIKSDEERKWGQTIRRTTFKRETRGKTDDVYTNKVVLNTNKSDPVLLVQNSADSDRINVVRNCDLENGPLIVSEKQHIQNSDERQSHGTFDKNHVADKMIKEQQGIVEISDNDSNEDIIKINKNVAEDHVHLYIPDNDE